MDFDDLSQENDVFNTFTDYLCFSYVVSNSVDDIFKQNFNSHSVLEFDFSLLDEISINHDASVLSECLPLITFLHSVSLFLLKHLFLVFDQIS
jgi:hypothetical protein